MLRRVRNCSACTWSPGMDAPRRFSRYSKKEMNCNELTALHSIRSVSRSNSPRWGLLFLIHSLSLMTRASCSSWLASLFTWLSFCDLQEAGAEISLARTQRHKPLTGFQVLAFQHGFQIDQNIGGETMGIVCQIFPVHLFAGETADAGETVVDGMAVVVAHQPGDISAVDPGFA